MTTTPTPTPENPDRPYTVHKDGHCWEVRRGSELFYASIHELWSRDHVTKLNDAHELAAKADRVPALEAEVKRLREALNLLLTERDSLSDTLEGIARRLPCGDHDDIYDQLQSSATEAQHELNRAFHAVPNGGEIAREILALTKAESTTRPEERAS